MLKFLMRLFNMDQFRSILLLLSLVLFVACSPSSDKSLSEAEPEDTTIPFITAISPEGDEVGFEVSSKIRIEFSELLDETSIVADESINLYSATVEGESTILYPVEANVEITKEINRGDKLNEATGVNSSTDVSVLYVTHREGRFAMNDNYVISVEASLRDLVEDDLETSEDERNYFDGPRAVKFTTESGSWANLGPTKEITKNNDEDENAVAISNPITLPVTSSNESGDLFYARVSQNTDLYVSKFSHYSNNWLNNNVEVSDECADWNESVTGDACVNSKRINSVDNKIISSVKLAVTANYAVLTWLQPDVNDSGNSLWASIYKSGAWGKAINVNKLFGSDDSIDVNMHSVAINDNHVLLAWRSEEPIEVPSEINPGETVVVDGEVVRTVSFNVEEAIVSENLPSPIVLINQEIVQDFNVLNIDTVWLNDATGLVLWTQHVNENQSGGIHKIFEKEINFIPGIDGDVSSVDKYVWSDSRVVDRYEFPSDEESGNHVVSFKTVVDSKGDLSLLWKKYDGRLDNLWFAKRVQKVWSTAEKLENNQAGSVFEYVGVFDSKDQLMIAWTQSDQEGDITVYFKSRHSGSIEEVSEELHTNSILRNLQIVFDNSGNGHLFWVETENTPNVISTTFYSKISETWSEVSRLASPEQGGNVKEINLSTLYKDGRILLLWNEVGYGNQSINQLIFE